MGSPLHGQEIDGESGANPERFRHCIWVLCQGIHEARLPARELLLTAGGFSGSLDQTMNYTTALHLVEAHHDGLPSLNGNSVSSYSFGNDSACKFGMPSYSRRSARNILCGLALSLATSGMVTASHAEDITSPITIEGAGNYSSPIVGYAYSQSIGTISSAISAISTAHYAYSINATDAISIDTITADAVVSASADSNYAYGIATTSGGISIRDSIAGAITATVNVVNAGASAYGYGIYAKSGDITLGGIQTGGQIVVSTPQPDKAGRLFGISTENGSIAVTGALDGTVRVLGHGTTVYGLWSKTGNIILDSIGSTGRIDVTGNFSSYGMYAKTGLTIKNALAGDISVISEGGNVAYALTALSNDSTIRSNLVIGSIASTSDISVQTGGYEACALSASYGFLVLGDMTVGEMPGIITINKLGNMDGHIHVQSKSTDTSKRFSAVGLAAQWGIITGDFGEGSSLIVESAGSDAFGFFTGRDGGSTAVNTIATLEIGNVNGDIAVSAASGIAGAVYSESSVTMGALGANGSITASSLGNAAAYAIYSHGSLTTGRLDGTVRATTGGDYSFAIMGLGVTAEIGEHAQILATGADSSDKVYALFSGCYQQSYASSGQVVDASNRQLTIYNLADTLTLHAGAQIDGIVELGGSGSGRDTMNLLGGTADVKGVLDYEIRTTINMDDNRGATVSYVQMNVGADDAPAHWEVASQNDLVNELNIGIGSSLTSNDLSFLRNGASITNQGFITGTGNIHVADGQILTTGTLSLENNALTPVSTGLSNGITVTAVAGARLGTTIENTTSTTWYISASQILDGQKSLFSQLIHGFKDDEYILSYLLSGRILVGADKPVEIPDGSNVQIGEGSTIIVDSIKDDASLTLAGGTADLSRSNMTSLTSSQVNGTSGNLIMNGGQEMVWNAAGTTGYSISGSDSSTPAGKLTVKAANGTVKATGSYIVKEAVINQSTLELEGKGAVLGAKGGTVTVGDDAPAGLVLRDATVQGALTVNEGSQLKGSGTFADTVALREAGLYVGNSPGYQNYQNGLSVDGGSVTFFIDGTTRATADDKGIGTYSAMDVQGSLGWNAPEVVLDLGSNLLTAGSTDISLNLIDASGAASVTGTVVPVSSKLAGETDLLEEYSLFWAGNQLIMTGTINREAAETIKLAEASTLVNALWSSTRSVANFSHTVVSQANIPHRGHGSIWVAGLGDFTSMSKDGSGFDYRGGGYALGGDYSFAESWATGLAVGQTFGSNKADNGLGKIDQDAMMLALYGRYRKEINDRNIWGIHASFAYGSVENKAETTVLSTPAHAKWDDSVFQFALQGTWEIKLSDRHSLTPFAGIDFIYGAQDDFTQRYGNGSVRYKNGSVQNWSVPVGVTWNARYGFASGQSILPFVTVAYVGDVSRDDPSVKLDSYGDALKAHGIRPGRNAFKVSAGLTWVIAPSWNVGAAYDLEYRSGMTNQGCSVSAHYTF